jgi:hypothetical protein
MAIERLHKLTVLLSDVELESLRAIAEANGQNVSDYLRQHIRTRHAELGGRAEAEAVRAARRRPNGAEQQAALRAMTRKRSGR